MSCTKGSPSFYTSTPLFSSLCVLWPSAPASIPRRLASWPREGSHCWSSIHSSTLSTGMGKTNAHKEASRCEAKALCNVPMIWAGSIMPGNTGSSQPMVTPHRPYRTLPISCTASTYTLTSYPSALRQTLEITRECGSMSLTQDNY